MRFNLLIFFLFINYGLFGQSITDKVEIQKVADNVYIHTTYDYVDGTLYPANGMFVIGNNGVVLVDTPWKDSQTQTLLDMIKAKFGKEVVEFIPTHYHRDRMGGINTILSHDIHVVMSKKTYSLAKDQYDLSKVKRQRIRKKLKVSFGTDISLQIYYPGSGHTIDNLVVYVPREQILFGGCLVKSNEAIKLNATIESDIRRWGKSIEDLEKEFRHLKYVIPGHGNIGDKSLLVHTAELVESSSDK